MQKKILSLAIAAAMVAPAAAMAEATLYGKLHMSVDYADVKNVGSVGSDVDEVPYDRYYAVPDVFPGTVTISPGGRMIAVPDTSISVDANGNPVSITTGGPNPQPTIVIGADGKPVISGGTDFKGWGISNNGSYMPGKGRANRIGVKGSEDLGNGLKAIYQVELGLNFGSDDLDSGRNGITYRNSFLGLAGSWGTALVGRHDTPLKISTGKLDQFSDTMADYNGTVGFDDKRVDNVIAYISPSFSGFSFMGAMVAGGGATATGNLNVNEDSLAGAYSLAGIYSNGPFYASLAYESLDSDMAMNSQTSLRGGGACLDSATGLPDLTLNECNYTDKSYDKWRIGLGLLDWNGFTLTAIYEQQEDRFEGQQWQTWNYYDTRDGSFYSAAVPNGVKKQQLWQIQAAYAFGNNTVKAMYGSVDRDDDKILGRTRDVASLDNLREDLEGDKQTWAIGFDHNFSKRTKAYVLYTAVDDDNNGIPGQNAIEWSGFSAGMIHKF